VTAPRIGITTYREPARWGEWDVPADLLPALYSSAVQGAGGLAVLLPPAPSSQAGPALDGVHALVIAGGPDVDPRRYHSQRDPKTGGAREERDGWELDLVHEALNRDVPLLGVCRGMQVLNTALGGTLIQHLPDMVGTDVHAPLVGAHGRHPVNLEPGSRLAAICGERIEIATHHHQALDELGTGLRACGWADDGTVEAVELAGRTWTIGVQWHPEAYNGEALFAALVTAAAQYRTTGAPG
jgi:putative glutamine amidotransferase